MAEKKIEFHEGPPKRPDIKFDNGFLDKFSPRPATEKDKEKYKAWRRKMKEGQAADWLQDKTGVHIRYLPDALRAYEHFLDATGEDFIIDDYADFLNDDGSGRVVLILSARFLTRQATEQVFRDRYEAKAKSSGLMASINITSGAIVVGGDDRFPYPDTENWQKAIGGHTIWLSAVVQATWSKGSKMPLFYMGLTIHAEDRYNFDPGKQDIATGTPDSENGLFEITGLAKQFNQYGTAYVTEWYSGATRYLPQLVTNMPATW